MAETGQWRQCWQLYASSLAGTPACQSAATSTPVWAAVWQKQRSPASTLLLAPAPLRVVLRVFVGQEDSILMNWQGGPKMAYQHNRWLTADQYHQKWPISTTAG